MVDTYRSSNTNKMVAMIAGIVLLLVGIVGFVMDPVIGLFEVSLVHNLVHLITGAILLGGAYMNGGVNARYVLLTLGVVYALVAILGFAAPGLTNTLLGGTATAPATNMADNFLHLGLAIVFIGVPLLTREESLRPMTGRPQM